MVKSKWASHFKITEDSSSASSWTQHSSWDWSDQHHWQAWSEQPWEKQNWFERKWKTEWPEASGNGLAIVPSVGLNLSLLCDTVVPRFDIFLLDRFRVKLENRDEVCEHHIPPHAHILSHMSTARVMAQENKFVVHHNHFRPSAMSLLRIDPDSLTSSFSSTSPTTFRPDPSMSMTTQNPTRTASTPPVEGFTTPRTCCVFVVSLFRLMLGYSPWGMCRHHHRLCTLDIGSSIARCVMSPFTLISPIMAYIPPCLLFPDGCYQTTFPTTTSTSTSTTLRPTTTTCVNWFHTETLGIAHSQKSGDEFVHLANPEHSTGYERKTQLNKQSSEHGEKTPINDPNHDNLSDFSRVKREDTELSVNVCVDPSVLHSVSIHCFHMFVVWEPASGNGVQTERKRREKGSGSVIRVEESNSRKSRRNGTRNKSVYSHQTLHDFEERDHVREHIERRALQATLGEIFAQRKLYSTEYDMEITDLEEIQNESQRELESQRRHLQQISQWADQAHRERISLCSELGRKNRLHREGYSRSSRNFKAGE